MKDNAWASVPVDERVVFELPFEQRWAGGWQTARHRRGPAEPGSRPCISRARARLRPETVLAFDFGLKRIGIASGDSLTRARRARPLDRAARAA